MQCVDDFSRGYCDFIEEFSTKVTKEMTLHSKETKASLLNQFTLTTAYMQSFLRIMLNLFFKTAYGNVNEKRDSIDLREAHQHREVQQALAFLVVPN